MFKYGGRRHRYETLDQMRDPRILRFEIPGHGVLLLLKHLGGGGGLEFKNDIHQLCNWKKKTDAVREK